MPCERKCDDDVADGRPNEPQTDNDLEALEFCELPDDTHAYRSAYSRY